MLDITEQIASKHLGKKSSGSEVYDPSLLVAVPRSENRKQYDIKNCLIVKICKTFQQTQLCQ